MHPPHPRPIILGKIVARKGQERQLLVIPFTSNRNNIVITTANGFRTVRRPVTLKKEYMDNLILKLEEVTIY